MEKKAFLKGERAEMNTHTRKKEGREEKEGTTELIAEKKEEKMKKENESI